MDADPDATIAALCAAVWVVHLAVPALVIDLRFFVAAVHDANMRQVPDTTGKLRQPCGFVPVDPRAVAQAAFAVGVQRSREDGTRTRRDRRLE